MDGIFKKINELKEKIKAQKRNKIREEREIKKALETFFESSAVLNFIESFYLKNENLIIKTRNKTFANEVFLKKEKLKEILIANGVSVKELVIH